MTKVVQKCTQEYLQKGFTRLGTHKGCGGFTGFANCRRPLNLEPWTGYKNKRLVGGLGELLEMAWGGLEGVLEGTEGVLEGLGGSWKCLEALLGRSWGCHGGS